MIGRKNRDEHVDTAEHDQHGQGRHESVHPETSRAEYAESAQRQRFGGINWGAGFFGWLVAIAVAVLLSSIVGAVAAGVGSASNLTPSDAQQQAGTVGIVAAIVLLVLLMIAYYTGGYVAGRMSRFDGGKQGLAVWVIGLLVTLLAVALGAVFGAEYNILARVQLPSIPVPTDALSAGGVITALAILVGTLLAAMAGGKVGRRYHRKVDRAALV